MALTKTRSRMTEGAAANVLDYGAVGDGSTDDTAAIQAAIDSGKPVYLPPGDYRITAPLTVTETGVSIAGAGLVTSTLVASGNFLALLSYTDGFELHVRDLGFTTTGTTTRCVSITDDATTPTFTTCEFRGNLNGSLVHSSGQIVSLIRNSFVMNSANTVGVTFDMFNQNGQIVGNRFGGTGKGIQVVRSGADDRVEGLSILNNKFINTGAFNISIADSFLTQIIGNICDQASGSGIEVVTAADLVLIADNWIGVNSGQCILLQSDAGTGTSIRNNLLNGGHTGIAVAATGSSRVAKVSISDNVFNSHSTQSLTLDSVNGATITGNVDLGTPSAGSWITSATHASGGSYLFDANRWHSTAPSAYHTGSTYRFGSDMGIVGRNNGTAQPGGSATTLTISHGLFRTPRVVHVTPEGSVGDCHILTLTSTNFQVAWATAGTPIWHWQAEV